MFQLERTSDDDGVLRVGFSRKLNEENSLCDITIPAEGMLYPIVRLSQKMQTYTFVPLDRVRADAPPSRSPSPCHLVKLHAPPPPPYTSMAFKAVVAITQHGPMLQAWATGCGISKRVEPLPFCFLLSPPQPLHAMHFPRR
jgi:hypothetical protein